MAKKTIIISTINVLDNYGNRLQNYALQEVLRQYGDVRTSLRIYNATSNKKYCIQFLKKKYLNGVKQILEHCLRNGLRDGIAFAKRVHRGAKFNKKYINENGGIVSAYKVVRPKSLTAQDLTYVIGSDQVWNFEMLGVTTPEDVLASFLANDTPRRKISYAASFGVDSIPQNQIVSIRLGLQSLDAISVREREAVEIVKKVTDEDVALVADPTLLIDADKWRNLAKTITGHKEKYIVVQLLGDIPADREQIIRTYARQHGCAIYAFRGFDDYETAASGPVEFINLIAGAEMIFTDSFHALCFSLIFERQFKLFNVSYGTKSKSTNSRMMSLLSILGIESEEEVEGEILPIDYSKVTPKLRSYRNKSLEWLASNI